MAYLAFQRYYDIEEAAETGRAVEAYLETEEGTLLARKLALETLIPNGEPEMVEADIRVGFELGRTVRKKAIEAAKG